MEDVRVSIRLTPEQHKSLKLLTIEKGTTIQELLLSYVVKLIEEGKQDEKN